MTDPFNCRTARISFIITSLFPIQTPVSHPLICICMPNTVMLKFRSTALNNHLFTGPVAAAPSLKGHLAEIKKGCVKWREKQLSCKIRERPLQESLRVPQSGFSPSVKTPLEHKATYTPLRAAAAFQDPKDSQQFTDLGSGPDALYISSQTAFGRKSFPLLQY